ncbi:hypothetical protein D3C87_1814960 [compost metagenome]
MKAENGIALLRLFAQLPAGIHAGSDRRLDPMDVGAGGDRHQRLRAGIEIGDQALSGGPVGQQGAQ